MRFHYQLPAIELSQKGGATSSKLATALVCAFLLVNSHAANANDTRTIEYQSGVELGHGYNAFTGEFTAPCFEGTAEYKPHGAAKTTFAWDEAKDHQSVRKAFRLDASASYKAFGDGVSGKTSYLSAFQSAHSTATGLAIIRSETGATVLQNAKLRPEILQQASTAGRLDPLAIRESCGTHYVRAINAGGELYGSITHTVSSEKEREEFRTAFSASGFGAKGSADTLSVEELERYRDSLTVVGGTTGTTGTVPVTLDELRSRFNQLHPEMSRLARLELDQNKRHSAPIDFVVVPIALSSADRDKLASLEVAVRKLELLRQLQSEVQAIATNPDSYNVVHDGLQETAGNISSQVATLMQKVRAQMRTCSLSPDAEVARACDFSRVARMPESPTMGLPRLFSETCRTSWTPPKLGSSFSGLQRTKGDDSMAGNDVVEIYATYDGSPELGLTQRTTLRIYETKGDKSRYGPATDERHFFRKLDPVPPGCFLKASVERKSKAGRHSLRSPNDYRWLTVNSGYVSRAECRSDRNGKDDGYVGCRDVEFLPVDLPLEHIERLIGPPPQTLVVPGWLVSASSP